MVITEEICHVERCPHGCTPESGCQGHGLRALCGFEPIPTPVGCSHPEHNAPTHLVIPYGMQYRHYCPGCGRQVVVRSSQITCDV